MKMISLVALMILLPFYLSANPSEKEPPTVKSKLCQMALIRIQEGSSVSSLFKAVEHEKIQDILTLTSHIPRDIKKDYLFTPLLLYASMKGKVGVISILVYEFGVDVNIKDQDGWTPLHYTMLNSSLSSRLTASDLFIDMGANFYKLDDFGHRPSQYAREGRHSGSLYSQSQQRQAVELVFKIAKQIVNIIQLNALTPLDWATHEVSDLLQLSYPKLAEWVDLYQKGKFL